MTHPISPNTLLLPCRFIPVTEVMDDKTVTYPAAMPLSLGKGQTVYTHAMIKAAM